MKVLDIARQCGAFVYAGMPELASGPLPARVSFNETDLTAFVDRIRADERERCAAEVPSNWLSPLLTGKDGLGPHPYSALDIERLLNGIRAAIRAGGEGERN